MDFAGDGLGRLAFSCAWQTTAVIGVVLVITRLFGRNRPHLAHALWLVVLLKCVTPPLWSSPSGVFTWLLPSQSWILVADSVVEAPRGQTVTETVAAQLASSDAEPLERSEMAAASLPMHTVHESEPVISLSVILIPVGMGGAALWFFVAGLRWARCVWKLWRMPAVDLPDLDELAGLLARKLKVRRPVRLLVTSGCVGPAVVGLLRPLIVLPICCPPR